MMIILIIQLLAILTILLIMIIGRRAGCVQGGGGHDVPGAARRHRGEALYHNRNI